jgi:hypothetical protein
MWRLQEEQYVSEFDELNALRETQVEQGQQIAELRSEVREGFTKVGLGMAQITALLTTHLGRSDET